MKTILLILALMLPGSVLAEGVLTPAANPPMTGLYDYRSIIELQDDFISGSTSSGLIGQLGWFSGGGTTTKVNAEAGRLGILRRDTSASSGTVAYTILDGIQPVFLTATTWDMRWIARANEFDANTKIRIGAASGCTLTSTTNGAYFEKLDADSNWFATTLLTAVGTTRVDTGIAANATWRTLQIQSTGTSFIFLVDGVVKATIATHIPLVGIGPCAQIVNSAAASKTMDIEYFQLKVTGLNR